MNKKIIITISVVMVVAICIIGGITLVIENKRSPIIFKTGSNGDYAYIIYDGKEYVPYCAISNNDRAEYLGYIEDDKQEEIYTYKGASKDEWLISFTKIGLGGESMLFKEKNVTDIPSGLSSEYDWNN